jgi:hypothetical protein
MLLNAEVKDDSYADLPRQQQAQYAHPAQTYLKADASTGRHYIDLNEAAKTYRGAWLFGEQSVEMYVDGLQAQWRQWCPIPAGIPDGVLLRGTVVYANQDKTYRKSNDTFEGTIETINGVRHFIGQTTHTFVSRYLPGGTARVEARLNIPLTQTLAYNPMSVSPVRQQAEYQQQQSARQPYYYGSNRAYQQPNYRSVANYQQAETESYPQESDNGY